MKNLKAINLIWVIFLFHGIIWSQDQILEMDISSRSFQLPVGVVDFVADKKVAGKFSEEPSFIISRDLNFSGQAKAVSSHQIDSSLWKQEGVSFFVHGRYFYDSDNKLVLTCYLSETVDLKVIIGKNYEITDDNYRQVIHQFSSEVLASILGEAKYLSSRILYVKKLKGAKGFVKEIFVSDYDGGGPKKVTTHENISLSPIWGPGKSKIFYINYLTGRPALYFHDMNTGSYHQIFKNHSQIVNADFNPYSSRLVFTAMEGAGSDLWIGDWINGKSEKITYHWMIETSASFAPSGEEIAYMSDRGGRPHIYVMDKDGLNGNRLTFQGKFNDSPDWSPDGRQIAYCAMDERGMLNITLMQSDGTDIRQLTHDMGNNRSPDWSSDGKLIAFSSNQSGKYQIYIMRSDGTQITQITHDGENFSPKWSYND